MCKVVGSSGCQGQLILLRERPKAFVPMTKCVFQGAVEHLNADIKKSLDCVPVTSRLLLLHHSLRMANPRTRSLHCLRSALLQVAFRPEPILYRVSMLVATLSPILIGELLNYFACWL